MPRITQPPKDFEDVFVKYGWRGVESSMGQRPTVTVCWLNFLGADRLKAKRKQYMKDNK